MLNSNERCLQIHKRTSWFVLIVTVSNRYSLRSSLIDVLDFHRFPVLFDVLGSQRSLRSQCWPDRSSQQSVGPATCPPRCLIHLPRWPSR
uniref:Uncharacterized protein n=1 Tax=Arundo donax TaxID=35708 RepID=A0A0A9GSA9_ARUDO